MTSHIRAVFFDIDRTLYEHSRDYVPPSSLAAIAALKARGIIPAIATGRGYCALPPAIDRLVEDGDIELVIASNGQYTTATANASSARTRLRKTTSKASLAPSASTTGNTPTSPPHTWPPAAHAAAATKS